MDDKEVIILLKDLMGRFSKSSNAKELLEEAVEFIESQQQEIERLKADKWISVDDRLPSETSDDDCNDVICLLKNPEGERMVMCLYTNGKVFVDTKTETICTEYVTHWQPLPNKHEE